MLGLMSDKEQVLAALELEQRDAIALWRSLSAPEWNRPSLCKGWTVKDVVDHTVAGEAEVFQPHLLRALDGRAAEAPIGFNLMDANEQQIARYRAKPASDLVEEAERVVAETSRLLRSMTDEQWNASSWNPISPGTVGFYVKGRIWEWWTHGQDIRIPLKRPSVSDAGRMKPIVEVVRDGITGVFQPDAAKGVHVSYGFRVGETAFTVRIDDGTCRVDNEFDPKATSRVTADPATFVLVGTGRIPQIKAVLTRKFKPSGNPIVGLRFLKYFAQP